MVDSLAIIILQNNYLWIFSKVLNFSREKKTYEIISEVAHIGKYTVGLFVIEKYLIRLWKAPVDDKKQKSFKNNSISLAHACVAGSFAVYNWLYGESY